MKIWSWRQAIQKSKLNPTTKLVLFNLSIYMNELGQSCFPSVGQQTKDTGLSNRSVCTHLQKAVEAGFIKKGVHGFSGQGWSRNEYLACYPKGSELDTEGSEPVAEGSEPNDIKAVKEVHTNSSTNSPKNTSITLLYFEDFWEHYPKQRRGNKNDTIKAYKRALKEKRATEEQILTGLNLYRQSQDVANRFAKGAAAWLNADGWSNDYTPPNIKSKANQAMEQTMRKVAESVQNMNDAGY